MDLAEPRASRAARALPVLLLAVAALLLHRAVLFGGRAYFDRDVEHFLYERLLAFRAAILSGALPLWNPYPAFGEPMLAVANAQLAYPTSWLVLLVSPETTQAWTAALHTFLAALGVYALGRELRLARPAAFAAGLLFALGGPLRSAFNQGNVLVGASWIAWAWLAFARAGRGGLRRDVWLAGAALAACLLAGSPESALIAAAGVVLALPLPGEPDAAARWRAVPRILFLSVIVGFGLSAVQWLPTAALAGRSVRLQTAGDPTLRGFWSNHPALLAQVVLPVTFDALPLTGDARNALYGGREPLLVSLYGGLAASGLALAGLLGPKRRGRAALAVLALGSLALSLGRYSPLWDVVSRLPLITLVRFPARFAMAAAPALALLAGFGLEALPATGVSRRRRYATLAAVVLLAGVAFHLANPSAAPWSRILQETASLGRDWKQTGPVLATFASLRASALFALPLILALVLAAGRRSRGAVLAATTAAGLAAVLDPAFALRSLTPSLPRTRLAEAPATLAAVPRARPNRTFVIDYSPGFAQAVLGRAAALPRFYDAPVGRDLELLRQYPTGSLGRFGAEIESLPVDTPLLRSLEVSRWVRLMQSLAPTVAFPRALELSGVSFLVSLHDPGTPDRLELASRSPGLAEDVLTFRVRAPLPRAYAVAGVRVASEAQAVPLLMDAGFDPLGAIVLPDGTPAPSASAGSVRVERLGFDRVVLDAELTQSGHVVLLESWDPGWSATVDGVPAPVKRANLVFRAVPVAAGRHRVELVYRPAEATLGAAISGVTLLLCGLAFRKDRAAGR